MIPKKIISTVAILAAVAAAYALGTQYQNRVAPSDKAGGLFEESAADPHAGHDHSAGGADEHPDENALDWCFEHRVPESECTLCHPELAENFKANNDWCGEHGLPESHCRLCNPGIAFPQEAALQKETQPLGEISVFFPENKIDCSTSESVIRFASAETAERAGLTFEPALESSLPTLIDAPGEVMLDATKTVAITSAVPISVTRWMVGPGDKVEAGQAIAEANSPDIADLKARLVEYAADLSSAEKEYSRKQALRDEGLVSEAEWIKMESSLDAARARYESARGLLLSAGISEGDLEQLRTGRAVSSKMLLRAPVAGALVERQASLGQLMEPGMSLAVISDPGALWIEARVGERDLWRIEAGQRAEFSSDGAALDKSVGEVIWVSQYLDKSTRSGIVRAQIEGSSRIRAGEYGRMTIHAGGDSKAALVPKDAVQWEGCCNVVFVREAADVYRPKKVRLARGDDSHYRVIDGLEGGEWLVVNGSYLLKTELKKSSIGAGCCGLDAES